VTLIHGVRLNFGFRMLKGENILIMEGETWHVCTDLNGKPKRTPTELGEKLGQFLTTDKHE